MGITRMEWEVKRWEFASFTAYLIPNVPNGSSEIARKGSHFCFRTAKLLHIPSVPFKLILQTGFDWIDLILLSLEHTPCWSQLEWELHRGKLLMPRLCVIDYEHEWTYCFSFNPCDLCNYWLYAPNTKHLGGIIVENGIGWQRENRLGTLCSELSLCVVECFLVFGPIRTSFIYL